MMLGDNFKSITVLTGDIEINVAHGGSGPPLLLLHGYPETHIMWHAVAPALARHFHVVCPDLRGYGDSGKPEGGQDHSAYSKRAMAQDMVDVMASLGHQEFMVAGHDRGARVTHRMVLDHTDRVLKACIMDIAPTLHMFRNTDQNFATGYYHWFFLIQPNGLPEHLIGADPGFYLTEKLKRWSAPGAVFSEEAVAEYIRCFGKPEAIHASCEDYRAAATIDLEHDENDLERKIPCPLLVLWGSRGFVNRTYDVLDVWRERGTQVQGKALDCGHFLPEEVPEAVIAELLAFFNPVHE